MREIGTTWLLGWAMWAELEPERGRWSHLPELKRCVEALHLAGIEVVLDMHWVPTWHWGVDDEEDPGFHAFPNPDRMDEWAAALRRLVVEFSPWVRHWKIMEEQNVMFYGDREDGADLYADALARAYDEIQRVNRDLGLHGDSRIQVVLGGIHVDQEATEASGYAAYVRALAAAVRRRGGERGRRLCDVLAIHAHRFPVGPFDRGFGGRGMTLEEEIDAVLAAFDRDPLHAGLPLWIPNLTWPAIGERDRPAEFIVSERTQALYLAQAVRLVRDPKYAGRIERFGQVDLRDPDPSIVQDVPRFEWYYGLIAADGRKKLAYEAHRRLAAEEADPDDVIADLDLLARAER
jgi:hypothetical protein